MKLRVTNLGRIKSAELELRPLTIFLGRNGTQKTWTAHSYFKLLEAYRVIGDVPKPLVPDEIRVRVRAVAKAWMALASADERSARVYTISRAALLGAISSATFATSLADADFASALGVPAPGARVTLEVGKEELLDGAGGDVEVTIPPEQTHVKTVMTLPGHVEVFTRFLEGPANIEGELVRALTRLAMAWRRRVRALPVERATLVSLSSLVLAEKPGVRLPRALVDFCYLVSGGVDSVLGPPSSDIEVAARRVLGGGLRTERGGLLFLYGTDSGVGADEVPIAAAASLVKSIAGLALALTDAEPGDAIIIDEPEMNAHPQAQIALVELFALLIRRGLHVLLITHSPYLVDHAAALVETSRLTEQARDSLKSEFALGRADVFLRPDEVAVYDFRGETVASVFDRETGAINWSTFTDVNEREGKLMNDILDREAGLAP